MNSKQISLTQRLTILYIVAICTLVILSGIDGLLGWRIQLKQASDSRLINIAGRQRMLSQKLTKAALGLKVANTASEEEKYLKELSDVVSLFSSSHQGLKRGDSAQKLPGNNSPEVTWLFSEIEPHYQAMLEASEKILVSQSKDMRSPLIEKIIEHENLFLIGMERVVNQYEKEATDRVYHMKQVALIIFIIILIFMMALLWPIKTINQRFKSLTRQVQDSGIKVTSSSTEIAASGRELEAMLAEQIASTNEVVATSKEISATAEELLRTMEGVATMSEETAEAADSGQQDLENMEKTMVQLAKATAFIAGKLGAIGEKANNINTVVTTITKVADRTNLLSLNAAIEAEKAGEYGAGFAVVAREIRRLADQTAIATLDIEEMVKDMQTAVSSGVMEMDKFTKEVNLGVAEIGNIALWRKLLNKFKV